jgi:RNA recognition motif-containing protein
MSTKIYVGGLPFSATDQDLTDLFSPYGTVTSARVVADRDTGRSRGFGFVEMATAEEAQAAISGLANAEMGGRALVINEARPQEPRSGGFRGGSRGGDRGRPPRR